MPKHEKEITQQPLTHAQDMEAFAEKVRELFPFARVLIPKDADGFYFSFVGVHFGNTCIMSIDRNELEDVKSFMYAYNTTQKGTEHA